MQIKVKKTHPKAVIPHRETDGSAAFDLTAVTRDGNIYGTGLSFEIPHGYAMFVYSRSGHGFKENTRLANCVGVVDSDYRGEVKVKLTRDDGSIIMPWVGDRVAQAVIMRLPKVEMIESDTLKDTRRGTGGFGSTGK